jgi:hypothetical protein
MAKQMKIREGLPFLLSVIQIIPFTSPFTSLLNSALNRKEHDEIWKKLHGIESEIHNKNSLLEKPLQNFIDLIEKANPDDSLNLRKLKTCLLLIKELNLKSKEGQLGDPCLDYEYLIGFIKSEIKPEDPNLELRLVSHELKKGDLIFLRSDINSPIGFCGIYPTNEFFYKTDHLFQEWNPEMDARQLCKLAIDKFSAYASVSELEKDIHWGPRRLNPALAYLFFNHLIEHDHDYGGIEYALPYLRLNEEGHFFADDIGD